MKRLSVEVWSDIACPWCSVGKRRLEAALARFAASDAVDVRWRAFELDPTSPKSKDPSIPYAERLAAKYQMPVSRAEEMIRTMTEAAAVDGLDFHFERIRPGNTMDAHRVIKFAESRDLSGAMKERFLVAYMTEGEEIGEPDVLARLASEVGLDREEVLALLETDALRAEVQADEELARSLGISGVPFFLIDGRIGLSGAQPADVLLQALTKAWDELDADGTGKTVDGPEACGPEGCA